jgi:hypothetical protein
MMPLTKSVFAYLADQLEALGIEATPGVIMGCFLISAGVWAIGLLAILP